MVGRISSDVKSLHSIPGENPTYPIESESLEAHVAICSERYLQIHQHLQETEYRLSTKIESNATQISKLEKVVIWGIGAIFVTLLSGVVAIVLK